MDVATDPTSNLPLAPPVPIVGTGVPAEPGSQAAGLRTKILQRIIALTRPAQLPKKWGFLGVTQSMRRLAREPSDLVASLQTEFSLDELLATRIVESGPDNQPRLSPIFGDASSSFVILGDAMKSPSDVISARGLLSSPTPDWLRVAAERADGLTRYGQPVLLAFSDAEVLILHRLRCPFTPAAGLEQLSGEQIRELFAARADRREQRKYTLTLVGWQIAECVNQPSRPVLSALAHISRIKTALHRDPAAIFAAWQPAPAEFRAIRDARSFADREAVWKNFSHSLDRSRFSPSAALVAIRDRTPIDYGTARQNLAREIERSQLVPHCGDVAAALARFGNVFQTDIRGKFHAAFAASSDPWEKSRLIMGEDLARCWFGTLDEVSAAEKIIAGEFPDQRDSAEQFDRKLRSVGSFAKLYSLRQHR